MTHYTSTKYGDKNLLTSSVAFKPFRYVWCYEAWLMQQEIHWLPKEVPMHDDVKSWANELTDGERNLITHILRLFTQQDKDVYDAYRDLYSQVFKNNEVNMMFTAFGNAETIHQVAYSHLIDTLGLPETEYSVFMNYKEMMDKHDLLGKLKMDSLHNIALSMAVFAAFTEGLQLFASFIILINFQRFNKMKGTGQIIAWSIRDESLHFQNIFKLYHTFLDEFGDQINIEKLNKEIVDYCRIIVDNEDRFINLAFEMGPVEGLDAPTVSQYIRYIADTRLESLGIGPIYNIKHNPCSWIDSLIGAVEHTNFFENRSTAYSKGATTGSWEDTFNGGYTLYTKPDCPYCDKVYAKLKQIASLENDGDTLHLSLTKFEIADKAEREKFYDAQGFKGSHRSMPKLKGPDGTWYMTSTEILTMLELYVPMESL